jgi:hypothetical protein
LESAALIQTTTKTLAFKRFKARVQQRIATTKKIERAATTFLFFTKLNNVRRFIFNSKVLMSLRAKNQKAIRFLDYHRKLRVMRGLRLNRKMERHDRKLNELALKQWCFFKIRLSWTKLKEYASEKKSKVTDERRALDMRKEHLRREGRKGEFILLF